MWLFMYRYGTVINITYYWFFNDIPENVWCAMCDRWLVLGRTHIKLVEWNIQLKNFSNPRVFSCNVLWNDTRWFLGTTIRYFGVTIHNFTFRTFGAVLHDGDQLKLEGASGVEIFYNSFCYRTFELKLANIILGPFFMCKVLLHRDTVDDLMLQMW